MWGRRGPKIHDRQFRGFGWVTVSSWVTVRPLFIFYYMELIRLLADRIIGANFAQFFDHKLLLLDWQKGFLLMLSTLVVAILDFPLATGKFFQGCG